MLHKNFQERPTASELLAMPLFACTQFYQILPEILHHHHHRQHHIVVPSSSPPIVRKHTPSTRTSGSSLPDSGSHNIVPCNSGFQSPVYAHGATFGISKCSPPSISTRTICAPAIISSDIHSSHHTTMCVGDLALGIEPYPAYQHHHRHSLDSGVVYV